MDNTVSCNWNSTVNLQDDTFDTDFPPFCKERPNFYLPNALQKFLVMRYPTIFGSKNTMLSPELFTLWTHIDVEAGLSLMKSTIAESGMGVTSRPYRTKHIEFWKHSMNGTRDRHPWYPRGVPWDQNFFFKLFFRQSNLGIYSYVHGLLRQKQWFKDKKM